MMLSRRQMIQLGAGAVATGIAGTSRLLEGAVLKTKIPVGLELWSVRDQCQRDTPGVLRAVGQMGFDAVELAHSYYDHDAATWRRLLDQNHLKCCGMHMSLAALTGDAFDQTVAIHKVLQTPYLIVASLPKKNVESLKALHATAELFNDLAAKLKPHGMQIGYHCHGGDFKNVEGQTPWEVLAGNTHRDVVMQLDIGNCQGGGGDPIAMLKKFPGRSISVHLKEYGGAPGAVFGEGDANWSEVFQICESTGGTRWYVIEEEGRKGNLAIEAVRRALRNFRKMGK